MEYMINKAFSARVEKRGMASWIAKVTKKLKRDARSTGRSL